MAPEPVLPSPPSEGGLLGGEEVIRDAILGAVAKGGIARRRRYCSSSGVGLARVGRRVVGLRGLDVCARLPHLLHPRTSRSWGTMVGSPRPFEGRF